MIGEQLLSEPKTMGECWTVFKTFGFMKPNLPLDDSLFPNARRLVDLNNEIYKKINP